MATRTPATRRPPSARFNRSAGPSTQRPAGRRASAATSRRSSIVPRRTPPKKTGMAKLAEGVAGALPGAGARKKASTGGGGKGRTAGLAMLAGAAGLAFKNRDKLQGMLRRKGSDGDEAIAPAGGPPTSAGPGVAGASSDGHAPTTASGMGAPESPAAPDAVPPPAPPAA
jgi:hypothetical protein